MRVRSEVTALIVEPTLGYDSSQPPTDLALGASPRCENWLLREGSIRPRPTLSQHTATPNPMAVTVTGGREIQSSVGTRYNLISGTTRLAYYSASSYSPTSQVSAGNLAYVAWSATTYDKTDIAQIYEPKADEMLGIVSTTSSYNTLICWKSGATIFSVVTQAPRARWVCAFDNFMLAGNIRDVGSAQSKYIQRVQWSDRGDPFTWTPAGANLAGNQDLLDARGGVQRLIAQESRVVIFTEYEIWVGVRDSFPNTFRFSPLDRSVGTPYGKTCVDTPKGIVFLSRDFMVYLLPKEGGPAVAIGATVRPYLRDNIAFPENAHACYDPILQQYQLYHPTRAGATLPRRALWLNVFTGSYGLSLWEAAPQNITTAWVGALSTGQAGQTWSSVSGVYTWASIPLTWNQVGATNDYGNQVTYLGSSDGTVWYLNSNGTTDDGTAREAVWVSGAMGADAPESQKVVNAFRLDYAADLASTVSVSFSRDQGETYDPAFPLTLVQSTSQSNAVGYPYTAGRYPLFKVTSTSNNFDLYRFWLALRIGGR